MPAAAALHTLLGTTAINQNSQALTAPGLHDPNFGISPLPNPPIRPSLQYVKLITFKK